MRAGRIEQNDRPEQLFARPANAFVAGFLGFRNLLAVERIDWNSRVAATTIGELPIAYAQSELAKNNKCCLLIRPDAAILAGEFVAAGWPTVKGLVVNASFRGSISRVEIATDADPSLHLTFDLPTRDGRPLPPRGTPIDLALNPEGLILIGNGETGDWRLETGDWRLK
jgi:putative spermidine/putrescine transport system ATP-binding protein